MSMEELSMTIDEQLSRETGCCFGAIERRDQKGARRFLGRRNRIRIKWQIDA